jgi:RHS repeat-associated protein
MKVCEKLFCLACFKFRLLCLTLNALGQRTKKTSGLTTTYYVYDEAGHLVYETSGLSSNVAYAYLDDTPVAVMPTTSQIDYIYADQLNTPRLITSTSNSIVWRNDQNDPFNSGAANSSPSGLGTFTFNLRFPGQYYDAETGLNYNINRDYDASTGRYVESDPIGLAGGSASTYGYVGGDPVSLVDPNGENALVGFEFGAEYGSVFGPIGTVVGGVVGAVGGYVIAEQFGNLIYSKGGNQNVGDTGLIGVSDEEVASRARDRSLSGEERRRYQKEEKARQQRNKQKRGNKC